ncbi:MAG TPA: DDE-type integrase/transposase/recombinase [Hyphomicrobiales bacterium]|nr:DDE-type integrase/transposase/recombinase [Hyphomicrobiales bacterium]
MREWLTARELAAEALPDFPGTERGVQTYAAREGWPESMAYARTRAGRGGGMEYHINLLPTLARLDYERRHRRIEAPEPKAAPATALGDGLSTQATRERDARLAIVAAFEAFSKGQRLGLSSRTQIFVDRYNMGSQAIEPWIKDVVPRLSKRSLARWRSAKFMGRADQLAVDRSKARKGKGVLDTANGGRVRTFVLALVAHQPHLSAPQVRTQVRAEFGDEIVVGGKSIAMPPIRTFQHFLARLKSVETVALTKLSNPDKYRSTMAPSGVGTLRWVTEPNTLWQIDASPVDALCVDGRHTIYACLDIATRRTILYVSRTPRAAAVALLIRKAILAWGVPETIKTDNGSDFVARDTKRLFAALDIEMELSDAYSPQQKGHVERVIGTFQHDCAALLPGFVGHSVVDRKAIEDRKSFAERLGEDTAEAFGVSLTGSDLQEIANRWVETIYAHRVHSSLGMSPAEAARRSMTPIRTVDERALDVLLMPVAGGGGIRTVTKFGVRVEGYHYVVNAALPGQRVLVRMDPNDAGRVLAFDAETGVYVGAGICPELAGLDPKTILAAKREAQTEILGQKTREARAEINRITQGAPLIERALQVAARDMPNVVVLPKREEAHETPAIAAALDAGAEPVPAPLSGRAAEIHAELKAETAAESAPPSNVQPIRKEETPQQRFRRALDLQARIDAGELVEAQDAVWLGGYQNGSEFRAMKTVYEDFGERALR